MRILTMILILLLSPLALSAMKRSAAQTGLDKVQSEEISSQDEQGAHASSTAIIRQEATIFSGDMWLAIIKLKIAEHDDLFEQACMIGKWRRVSKFFYELLTPVNMANIVRFCNPRDEFIEDSEISEASLAELEGLNYVENSSDNSANYFYSSDEGEQFSEDEPDEELNKFDEALFEAVTVPGMHWVEALVLAGANPQVKHPDDGHTPLHMAVLSGRSFAARALLEKANVPVDLHNEDEETSLHCAAKKGKVNCARLLLRHKADVELSDGEGQMALHVAVYNHKGRIVDLLREHGVLIYARNRDGQTAVHIAAQVGDVDILQKLLAGNPVDPEEQVLLIDAPDDYGNTPLHTAVQENKKKVVQKLLELGAQKEIENEEGITPYQLAEEMRYKNCMKLLQ